MVEGRLSDIAYVTGGKLVGEDVPFRGVFTDSRQPVHGAVFWALKGENFDGNTFASVALKAGAAGVVVSGKKSVPRGKSGIVVDDTLEQLGFFAAYHRPSFKGKVIAVTGSYGKTTAKNLLALLFGERTYAAPASFNNRIGIPLTLLNAPLDAPYIVMEAGVNHRGEMAPLADILQPNVAVFTGVGPVHLEGLGDINGVAEEKGVLSEYVAPGGMVILPVAMESAIRFRLIRRVSADVIIQEVTPGFVVVQGVDSDGLTIVEAGGGEARLSICPVGQADTLNLAWRAAELISGASGEVLLERLKNFHPTPGRWNIVTLAKGRIILVDDAFNANPVSMSAALEGLSKVPTDEKLAVLGDMRELGQGSEDRHVEIGKKAIQSGLSALLLVGQMADKYREGYGTYGVTEAFSAAKEAAEAAVLRLKASKGRVALLVKGSHAVGLDEVVSAVRTAFSE